MARPFSLTDNDKQKLKFLLDNQDKPFATSLVKEYKYSRQAAGLQLWRFVLHGFMDNPRLGEYAFKKELLPFLKKIANSA